MTGYRVDSDSTENCSLDGTTFYDLLQNAAVNKKVAILYMKNGYAAERSYRIKDIIDIYQKETNNILEYLYLEITKNSEEDYANLVKLHYETNIFISAIGSDHCQYLNTIFFENTPGVIHLNSYSTASSLDSLKKLLRIQIPDSKIPVVYHDLIKREKSKSVYIVRKNGTYYQGLTNDLVSYFEKRNIEVIKIVNINKDEYDEKDILKVAKEINTSEIKDILTVIFIVDYPMDLIKLLQENDTEKIPYNILISDSGAQQLPDSLKLLEYIKDKNSNLITKFISDTQLDLANKYNQIINDPSHPVSSILSLTLSIIDMAENIILTEKKFIYKRKNYVTVLLDDNLDNTEAIWGIYGYRYIENKNEFSLDLSGLSFYYGDKVFTSYKD